jgi:cyclic pyranopterin phosphate synthase
MTMESNQQQNGKLTDRYNRSLNYLRVSITDRCNLRCIYCVPPELAPKLKPSYILSYEEILHLIRIGVGLGISKVRITGGEPLVRKGVLDFLHRLGAIEGLADRSLTTNGIFLGSNIDQIKAAGIHRINVSLDTLDPQKFQKITGKNLFNQVWAGILKAYEAGMQPIKINVVALKGINDDEFADFARLTYKYPFHIRFIEYMPIGQTTLQIKESLLAPQILARLQMLGPITPVAHQQLDGPAQRYRLKGARGEIGFIRPMSDHFCDRCNRLRLTASGQLRACLLSDYSEDLKSPLRLGATDEELSEIFLRVVRHKPLAHRLRAGNGICGGSQMVSIGG